MKTDQLVAALARDAGPTPRHVVERRVVIAAGIGLALALLAVPALFGFRTDIGGSWPAMLLKIAFGLTAAATAAPLLFELARPNTRIQHVLAPVALFTIASTAIAA